MNTNPNLPNLDELKSENEKKSRDYFKELWEVSGDDGNFFKKLYDYIFNFFGYGNLNGKYWFVGIEEGGGYDNVNEVKKAIKIWDEQKGKIEGTTLDIFEYYKAYFGGENNDAFKELFFKKPQKTWEQVINILFSYNNKEKNTNAILEYQHDEFGRRESGICHLNLLPLSCKRVADWKYNDYFPKVNCLKNKDKYIECLIEYRIGKIKDIISEKKPDFVVFYTKNKYRDKKISNIFYNNGMSNNFYECFIDLQDKKKSIYIGKLYSSIIVICYHPASIYNNKKDEYFINIGKKLRELTDSKI